MNGGYYQAGAGDAVGSVYADDRRASLFRP